MNILFNDTTGDSDQWYWLAAGAGTDFGRPSSSDPWNESSTQDLAFYLTDGLVVPEPSTWLLLAAGVGVLALKRRRARPQPP